MVEKPASRLGAALEPADPHQNMTSADSAWYDLSFEVTRERIVRFRLQTTKCEMKRKNLLLAMWAHYNDTYPVPER